MKLHLTIPAAMMLIALTGCNSPEPKIAHVKMVTASHTIMLEGGKKHLSQTDGELIEAFVASVPPAAIVSVTIESNDASTAARNQAKLVRAYLLKQGIKREMIHMEPTAMEGAEAIVLNMEYAKALPPTPCPDWSKNATANYENTRLSNFGCATENNLVMQLSNPADLESGHGVHGADAARDSIAIQRYLSTSAAPAASAVGGSSSGTSAGSSIGSPQ